VKAPGRQMPQSSWERPFTLPTAKTVVDLPIRARAPPCQIALRVVAGPTFVRCQRRIGSSLLLNSRGLAGFLRFPEREQNSATYVAAFPNSHRPVQQGPCYMAPRPRVIFEETFTLHVLAFERLETMSAARGIDGFGEFDIAGRISS